MDTFGRESGCPPPEEDREIVLTYHPPEDEVTLRYERPLPPCMQPDPFTAPSPREKEKTWSPLNPPEKPRARWGVRIYVGVSLLLIVCCLGVGIWYISQYGFGFPRASQPDVRNDNEPGRDWEYYWKEWYPEEPENTEITIPAHPTGGETRLTLNPDDGLPVLTAREVYDQVTPSVTAVIGRQGVYADRVSVGTGVIFSEDGYVLTNCHVIAGCSSCMVWVSDAYGIDQQFDARVVGYDEDADLAVLKIEAEGLPAAEFGISDDLEMGDPVYAIGNPLGVELRNTLTDGIVSAINRDVDVDGVTMTLIQTTAALNSGNSGGPLINQYGQVIGINTIKMMSEYDTIEGLGFAIPSSIALRWVNELVQYGELQPQPVLGVTVNKIPEVLPDGRTGLKLEEITEGLSGDRAGLKPGDLLTAFNGREIVSFDQLLGLRRELYVGDEVPVQVWRAGEYLELTMIMMADTLS